MCACNIFLFSRITCISLWNNTCFFFWCIIYLCKLDIFLFSYRIIVIINFINFKLVLIYIIIEQWMSIISHKFKLRKKKKLVQQPSLQNTRTPYSLQLCTLKMALGYYTNTIVKRSINGLNTKSIISIPRIQGPRRFKRVGVNVYLISLYLGDAR